MSTRELHARWFGKDVVSWLKGLFNHNIKPEFTHNIDTTFTAILIKEQWGPCKVKGVDVQANLLAQAQTNVKVATSFGLTLITKLALPLDLSQSYLYFKNKGEVSATFTLDAVGRASFETGDKELLGLQNFLGATFGIPKLLTVGPNFRLFGAVEASVTLASHFESKVDIAKWEIQQTYPDQDAEAGPKALSDPSRDGTGSFNGLSQPTFDYSVTASGQMTAHLKPTFESGIVFDKMWNVGDAKVDVVADGWVRLMAAAGVSSQGNCPFTYGIDVGADLYANVEAPAAFGWKPTRFPIASMKPVSAKEGGTCPEHKKRSLDVRRDIQTSRRSLTDIGMTYMNDTLGHQYAKRGQLVGPLLKLPKSCFFCPSPSTDSKDCATVTGWEPDQIADQDSISKRDAFEHVDYHFLEKRNDKTLRFCEGVGLMTIRSAPFDPSGEIVTASASILYNKVVLTNSWGYRRRHQ